MILSRIKVNLELTDVDTIANHVDNILDTTLPIMHAHLLGQMWLEDPKNTTVLEEYKTKLNICKDIPCLKGYDFKIPDSDPKSRILMLQKSLKKALVPEIREKKNPVSAAKAASTRPPPPPKSTPPSINIPPPPPPRAIPPAPKHHPSRPRSEAKRATLIFSDDETDSEETEDLPENQIKKTQIPKIIPRRVTNKRPARFTEPPVKKPRPNPIQENPLSSKPGPKGKSKYNNVSWCSKSQKWKAIVYHKGKPHYNGIYENQLHAAISVNEKCRELGIQIKNPQVEHLKIPRQEKKTVGRKHSNSSSQYRGVTWVESSRKWKAMFGLKGKQHYCGYYEAEIEAARAVNTKCRELNIEIKNPEVEPGFKAKESSVPMNSETSVEGQWMIEYILDIAWQAYFAENFSSPSFL